MAELNFFNAVDLPALGGVVGLKSVFDSLSGLAILKKA